MKNIFTAILMLTAIVVLTFGAEDLVQAKELSNRLGVGF